MSFAYPFTVPLAYVDAAGILFFSRIFEICHEAYEAFLRDRGSCLEDHLGRQGWVLPIVHAEVDFVAPLRLGDHVEIQIEVERMGTSSVTLAFHLIRGGQPPCAIVRHVHVAVQRDSFRPRPLPASVRSWGESP